MKLSVSLPDDDIAVIDEYVAAQRLPSRSAAIHRAVQMLRYPSLEDDYAQAWGEWSDDDDATGWESTSGDGVH